MKIHFGLVAASIFLVLSAIQIKAQTDPAPSDSLYSKILNEQRQFKIIYPKKYDRNSNETFDVLYVLDGEWNTSLTETVYGFLEYAKFVPTNIIIVSVPNHYKDSVNMRDRDFTPTAMDNTPFSGGADKFLQFLKQELMPLVNKKIPNKIGDNVLYGTSLGGLFTIYAYLQNPTLFKSYLTVEPSLWWDKQYINQIAPEKLKKINGTNTLWISNRDGEPLMGMGVSPFDVHLKSNTPTGLRWKTEAYSNETHFSTIWKGIYDGLKFIYEKPKK